MHLWKRTERLPPYNGSWMTLRAREGHFSRTKLAVNFQVQVDFGGRGLRWAKICQNGFCLNGGTIRKWETNLLPCMVLQDCSCLFRSIRIPWSGSQNFAKGTRMKPWSLSLWQFFCVLIDSSFFAHPLSSSYSCVASSQFQLLQIQCRSPQQGMNYLGTVLTFDGLRAMNWVAELALLKGTSWPWRRFGNTHL